MLIRADLFPCGCLLLEQLEDSDTDLFPSSPDETFAGEVFTKQVLGVSPEMLLEGFFEEAEWGARPVN